MVARPGRLRLIALAVALAVLTPTAIASLEPERASSADRRAAKPALSIPALEQLAKRRWPESFAGLWQARGKIFIAFTARARRRVGRLREVAARPKRLRPVHFGRSLKQLVATQEQMIADREERPPGTVDLPAYDLDIDVTRNALVVTLETVIPDWTARFKELYGQHVIVRQGPLAEFDACLSRQLCTPYLRSGLSTLFEDRDGALLGCSTGFAVQQRSAVYRGILSAAHCGDVLSHNPRFDEGGLRYHYLFPTALAAYGVVDRDRLMGRVDAEVHEITNPFFSRRPWIFDSSGLKARPVQRVSQWDWVRPGMGVCKAGITTGKTCGKVTSRYFSPDYVPYGERFITTTYCAEGGDSGGGVYYPNKLASGETKVTAYGIHSGGLSNFECNADNTIKPGDYSWFGHIQYAQTALGVRVQIAK